MMEVFKMQLLSKMINSYLSDSKKEKSKILSYKLKRKIINERGNIVLREYKDLKTPY